MTEFEGNLEEPLTSTTRPATMAIITVRIIKSFHYRNERNYVIHDIDLTKTTAGQLLEKVKQAIQSEGSLRPYRNVDLDTIKIYTKAHGTKSMNLIINLDNDDELILSDPNKTLQDYGIENETELSVFNREAYEEYKKNPTDAW